MTFLELEGVSKAYGSGSGRSEVLHDINLRIDRGEFIAIVGFSGSGKTTLISTIAGLVQPDAGQVRLQGKPVAGPGPERGVVFQSYSLMPWLTVYGNVALAVDAVFRNQNRAERDELTRKYIEMVGLSHALERRPAELSGGMRQRVAVARALAMRPEILLLDEPLSALDALTRAKLQDEIVQIWERERKTVVLITNDVDEAILLADRIIPLTPGPRATLGPEFKVPLERPRDRTAMNHSPAYRGLRKDITEYLMAIGNTRSAAHDETLAAPSVVPINVGKAPPKAYRERADSPISARYVEFSKVSKVFPTPKGPLTVVADFSLTMQKGEFISLIGHSGCGKSTVLSMVAGLADVSGGGIILDRREINSAGPDRGVVFQAPSLFPWMTAAENVALGVDRVYPHVSRAERRDVVAYYLDRVGLGDAMHKRASELSNGMKQRVGIARAFALSPKLLLLDEPFGMLDSLTRWDLQEVLMEVWSRTQVTAICVTHDVDEAILLADRVVMMTNGPNARIGNIMEVDIPRPRTRTALLEHPDYYRYREALLTFLEEYEQAGSTAGGGKPATGAKKAA
ncbi:Nitrate/sulfonate/bicarbonate ABC transporter ATP-binding protein [uncultured Defluviicoccus sp.]|uniref:Nitrate/sulfonate/bicarbonate ABC transporter ATP-binding protein n=1 Tax=metagenome TaxID=256318 RepID=A0A380TCH2_9ZZZZ|nr:Nitrate/sulfonate/bicarbonate ABC transporter ATP-binding protein [uncultured Defluviicoccus sp.]